MSSIRPSGADEDAAWDAFVARHPAGHLLQSSGWAAFRAQRGWSTFRLVAAAPDGELSAGAQVLVRRTRGGSVAYVPRGPVCLPDHPAWPDLLTALRRACGDAVFLRLEPHWPDSPGARAALAAAGLREAEPTQPPSTVRLDLRPGEDDLLAGMRQKWRYNVRLAARSGVAVSLGRERDLVELERLMAVTAARDRFGARAGGYYSDAWRVLGPDVARLYLARYRDAVLGAILVFHFGDTATYLYGASSDDERQRMPNHLLQWEAMRRARAAGLTWYDFWGIPDAIGRAVSAGRSPEAVVPADGGLWGVWGFKRGFGGEVFRTVGAWDAVYRPWRYVLGTRIVPAVRARLRRTA